MKNRIIVISITIALIVPGSLIALGGDSNNPSPCIPGWIPYEVWGYPTFNGDLMPEGDTISAWVDGTQYATDSIIEGGNFAIDIYWDTEVKNWPVYQDDIKDGCYLDDIVYFSYTLNNITYYAEQTISWYLAGDSNIDLQFTSTSGPCQLKINEICTDDGLGNQYATIYNPTNTSIILDDYYLEKDVPGLYNYHGLRLNLTGTIAPSSTYYVGLGSTGFLNNSADELKLAWENPGIIIANGYDIIIDRVEFGDQELEPDNTWMGDAETIPIGGSIIRWPAGHDTDNCTNDFILQTNVPISYDIPLKQGWNMISLPLIQSNTSLEAVLHSIDGLWDNVKYYDSSDSNDPWKSNRPSRSVNNNDLNSVDHTMGFWIHMINDTILTVFGTPAESTNIILNTGWNLVGYPSLDDAMTVSLALWGTGADRVEVFDPAAPYLLREVDSSYILQPGEGYRVHVSADTVWTIP